LSEETPIEVTPEDLAARLASPGAPFLLDVRQPDEHAHVHIAGSRLIPLNEIPARLAELDAQSELVAYCHHGIRSLHAARWLRAHGFPRAQSLAGGIDAWTDRVDPTLPRY
jgi:rhodanese-related sulfurtransferase